MNPLLYLEMTGCFSEPIFSTDEKPSWKSYPYHQVLNSAPNFWLGESCFKALKANKTIVIFIFYSAKLEMDVRLAGGQMDVVA